MRCQSPVIVVEHNAGFLCTSQSTFRDPLPDVCSKLTSFDFVSRKNHLVWLDCAELDDGGLVVLVGFCDSESEYLLTLDLSLLEPLGCRSLGNVDNLMNYSCACGIDHRIFFESYVYDHMCVLIHPCHRVPTVRLRVVVDPDLMSRLELSVLHVPLHLGAFEWLKVKLGLFSCHERVQVEQVLFLGSLNNSLGWLMLKVPCAGPSA